MSRRSVSVFSGVALSIVLATPALAFGGHGRDARLSDHHSSGDYSSRDHSSRDHSSGDHSSGGSSSGESGQSGSSTGLSFASGGSSASNGSFASGGSSASNGGDPQGSAPFQGGTGPLPPPPSSDSVHHQSHHKDHHKDHHEDHRKDNNRKDHSGGLSFPGGQQALTALWNALTRQAAVVRGEEAVYQAAVLNAKSALGEGATVPGSVYGSVYVTQTVYGVGGGITGTLGPSNAVLLSGLQTALQGLQNATTPQAALQALGQAEQDAAGLQAALHQAEREQGGLKERLSELLQESGREVKSLELRVHQDRLAAAAALQSGKTSGSAREALLRYGSGLHDLHSVLMRAIGELKGLLQRLG